MLPSHGGCLEKVTDAPRAGGAMSAVGESNDRCQRKSKAAGACGGIRGTGERGTVAFPVPLITNLERNQIPVCPV
jgi:hypothetical protein